MEKRVDAGAYAILNKHSKGGEIYITIAKISLEVSVLLGS